MRNKRIRVVTREYIALAPCTIYGGESVFYFTDLSEQQLSVTTIRNEVRTMENIIVGGAWPYANGSLHIGHIAALLPGDVLARYFRAKGNRVFYVSGSDCHGTPITIRAKQEHSTPGEISEHYHREFCDVFKKLGFSYDLYTKTSDTRHKKFVTEFHKKLYTSDYIAVSYTHLDVYKRQAQGAPETAYDRGRPVSKILSAQGVLASGHMPDGYL